MKVSRSTVSAPSASSSAHRVMAPRPYSTEPLAQPGGRVVRVPARPHWVRKGFHVLGWVLVMRLGWKAAAGLLRVAWRVGRRGPEVWRLWHEATAQQTSRKGQQPTMEPGRPQASLPSGSSPRDGLMGLILQLMKGCTAQEAAVPDQGNDSPSPKQEEATESTLFPQIIESPKAQAEPAFRVVFGGLCPRGTDASPSFSSAPTLTE